MCVYGRERKATRESERAEVSDGGRKRESERAEVSDGGRERERERARDQESERARERKREIRQIDMLAHSHSLRDISTL